MVILLSLLSLIGVFIVPLVRQNERCGVIYEHVNLFLVAMGTSALFSDAILHLIPQVRRETPVNSLVLEIGIYWWRVISIAYIAFILVLASGGKVKSKVSSEVFGKLIRFQGK